MIRQLGIVLFVCICVLVLYSCSSTKKIQTSQVIVSVEESEYIQDIINKSTLWNELSGKVTLDIEMNGKSPIKVGGNIKIIRDKVIQISVAPFLGIEVARAEITPEGMLIVDRLNKRFVETSFKEISDLSNCQFSYNMLQSLFLNSIFIGNKSTPSDLSSSDFTYKQYLGDVILASKKWKSFDYVFITLQKEKRITNSRVSLSQSPYGIEWRYDDFKPLNNVMFPNKMTMSVNGTGKPMKVVLDFSRLSTQANWVATAVSSRYEKIELKDIIKSLIK